METITYYIENNLLIGANLILYAIGSYIQIKVISTCRKEKDKVWQITITNSITMMTVFSFVMIFQTVSSHVPVMSQYTGEWICFIAAFIYIYGTLMMGVHSFVVSLMKFVFIVYHETAFTFGEDKLKKVFFVVNLVHALVLSIPALIFHDFHHYPEVIECLGIREKVLEHSNTSNAAIDRTFFCKLNDGGYNKDAEPQLSYILKQSFCATRTVWLLALCSNLPEGVLYHYIFRKMRR